MKRRRKSGSALALFLLCHGRRIDLLSHLEGRLEGLLEGRLEGLLVGRLVGRY